MATHPSGIEAGMLAAVEDVLAFRRDDLSEISTFALEEIHSHLSTPVKRRPSLARLAEHAKHFYERQAQKFGIPKDVMFREFSSIVDHVMGIVSDEHYDRLHAARVKAGLVDGKK